MRPKLQVQMESLTLDEEECTAQQERTGTRRRTECGASNTKEERARDWMLSLVSFGSRYRRNGRDREGVVIEHDLAGYAHWAGVHGISPLNPSGGRSLTNGVLHASNDLSEVCGIT